MKQSFFLEFLKSPKSIGAVAPSSKTLARAMLTDIDFDHIHSIVEYGAGTGSFTKEIVDQLTQSSTFLSYEKNQKLCSYLQLQFPQTEILNEDIIDLPKQLDQKNIESVDCIISGLPFAVFNEREQNDILNMSASVLNETGTFRTFAYLQGTLLPAGIRFKNLLKKYFSRVDTTPTVWRNLPPAFVYICHK